MRWSIPSNLGLGIETILRKITWRRLSFRTLSGHWSHPPEVGDGLPYAQAEAFGDLTNLTPMHVAPCFGLTRLIDQLAILPANAEQVHKRDSWDCQPLHWAAFQGHDITMRRLSAIRVNVNDWALDHNIITRLLEANGVQNMASKKYGSALAAAASSGHSSIVDTLLRFDSESGSRQRAVTEAAENGDHKIVKIISSKTNLLQAAALQGMMEAVKLLLENGASPSNAASCEGSDNSTPLVNTAFNLLAEDLEIFIRPGAQVDTADADGSTALIISTYVGDDACVECLINHGVSVKFSERSVYGGERDVEQMVMCAESIPDLTLRKPLGRYRHKIEVNTQPQASEISTTLHTAALERNYACLRLVLEYRPLVLRGTTGMHVCYSRWVPTPTLWEEPTGRHSKTLLSSAPPELVDLLLERGPLLATVVRDYHCKDETDVLETLLTREFPVQAYRAALIRSFS
ncbi:ankyrin [Xylariaceae sp. AK1471]|nr:ankyrin [Xylariaceae sp. AK1471]